MDSQENSKKLDENIKKENKKAIPLKNRYTLKQKLDVIKEAEITSIHATSNKYGIDRASIRDWIKMKTILEKENNKNIKFRIKGAGRKPYTFECEPQILQWIIYNRKLGISLTVRAIIGYLIFLNPDIGENKTYDALKHWCTRFLKRHSLVFRKAGHIGQPLPKKVNDVVNIFLRDIIRARENMNITDDKLNLIINIDETPIYFEMPEQTTIELKGTKNVKISTFGNDKNRVSVILAIAGNGEKLAPMMIFKGQPGKTNEKKLQDIEEVKKKQIFICCQQNSWATTDIFIKWYNQIFKPYETLKAKNNCLLILDKAPSHFNPKVIDLFDTNQQQYIFIPPGLTPYLQPLDIGVNKPFKSRIKNYYLKYQISKCDKMDSSIINEFNKVSKEAIVKFVNDSWWNEKDGIKKEFIINSFRKSGITLKMDGSEDDLFEYPNEIVERNNTDNLIDDDDEEKKSESDSENDSDSSGH